MSSKSRTYQPKEKIEENSLFFMLFAEIERLLRLLNEKDQKNFNLEKKHESEKKEESEVIYLINRIGFFNKSTEIRP